MSSTHVENFATLLRALSLVEGSYKPFPSNSLTSNITASSMGYSHFYGSGFLGAPVDTTFNATPSYPAMGGTIGSDAQCSVVSYDSPSLANETFWSFDPVAATVYRYRRQQSVNLGSWQVLQRQPIGFLSLPDRFVQENWMVPSLFTCASEPRSAEVDVASGWGSVNNARAVLERHWDSFVNQTDFDYLASIGNIPSASRSDTGRSVQPLSQAPLSSRLRAFTPTLGLASSGRSTWPRKLVSAC